MSESTRMTILQMGVLIGQALKEDNISQAEFARRLGVSEKHISKVCTGLEAARAAELDYWAFNLNRRFTTALERIKEDGGGE